MRAIVTVERENGIFDEVGVGNAEQDIRFLSAYEGYSAERKALSIAAKRDRIARCNAALSKLT